VRLSASEIAAGGLAAAVARAGLAPPVLVRPVASHGGQGLVLATDWTTLERTQPQGDVYVSRFHDFGSADGYYRKYRTIFIDRRPYPYHLAISPQWLVHHQSSEMADDGARKHEELDFLAAPEAALGRRAMTALQAIGRRLDLDYAGIDFSLLEDGGLLVFEANAAMLTHLEPADGPFAAKNPFIQRIIDAFQTHLAVLAARGRS